MFFRLRNTSRPHLSSPHFLLHPCSHQAVGFDFPLLKTLQMKGHLSRMGGAFSGFSSKYIYEEIYYRNWLTCLWRPRSLTVFHLQAGDPGKIVMWFSPEPEAWELGLAGVELQSLIAWEGREGIFPSSAFCSVRALKGLDEACQH